MNDSPPSASSSGRSALRHWVPSRRRVIQLLVRCRRVVVKRVLRAEDPPHRLALGVAIGLFVTFTPTVGFQSMLVLVLAGLLGGNKLVGLPVVWISNPATFVPIYYPAYRIGLRLTGGQRVTWPWWRELARPPEDYLPAVQFYWSRVTEIIVPLTTGCMVIAFPVAIIGYFATYQAVVRYRLRRIFRRDRTERERG